jgi:DnaJ-class molecular chaperone
MAKFRTHYDNLKVSRDAPIEVIQAAYRSLARKYHPDRNASTPKNEAIMKVINASYEVLSDPVKRAKHDQWIADQMGHPWRGSASAENSEWGIPAPGNPRDGSGWQQWSVTDVMVAVAYFGTALALLRIPNLRFVAIGMLVAGWLYFRSRRR